MYNPLVYLTYDPGQINTVIRNVAQSHLYTYVVRDLQRLHKPEDPFAVDIQVPWKGWPTLGLMGDETVVSIDTEYTPHTLLDIAFANAHTSQCASPKDEYVPRLLKAIDWICGHAVHHDIDQLVKQGWCKETWVRGEHVIDSMLLMHNVDENRNNGGNGGYTLENCVAECITLKPWKQESKDLIKHPEKLDPEVRAERCRKDAWASATIIQHQLGHSPNWLEAQGMGLVIPHRIAQAIRRLYHAGAYVDEPVFREMEISLTEEMEHSEAMFREVTAKGYTKAIDLTNDGHIRDFLFGYLKLPVLGKTANGLPSIEAKYVEYYAEENTALVYLSKYLKDQKILSTYVSPLHETMDEQGWMPIDLGMLTRTGRRHGFLHTWPTQVRGLLRSRYPRGTQYGFDYAKLEIIILSVLAQEWNLYEYFVHGTGYIGVGEQLIGKTVEKDTIDYRLTKATVLGMNYGLSPWSLAKKLWYDDKVRLNTDYTKHKEETEQLVHKYFKVFPRLKVYQRAQQAFLDRHHYVELPDGRRRHLPLPLGRETQGYRHMVNEAINNPVQGIAALLTGTALVDAEDALVSQLHCSTLAYHQALMNKEWPNALIWLEHHDYLGFDGKDTKYAKVFAETLENCVTFRKVCPQFKDVEFKVEMKEGSHWQ